MDCRTLSLEYFALRDSGIECSLFDFDSLDFEFRPKPRIESDDTILYRGWMECLLENISSLNWKNYFIKDYVKSNSNEKGSIAKSPEEAIEIVSLIEKFRGSIEGGISVRRVKPFVEGSEKRYFSFGSKAYSPDHEVPELVQNIAAKVNAPFFSIDTILVEDGTTRLVELGDGQVSDKKSWPLDQFVKMVAENAT